jgi:predicted Na+-dependent transporter
MDIMKWFNITVVVFTVSGLMAGGLECNLKDAIKWLRSPKLLVPCILWSWVFGPALAWLLCRVLPLSPGHAAGLMLTSLAPIAPFLPLAAMKARGDMNFNKPTVATKIFPWVKKTSGVWLLLCLGTTLWIYGKQMLSTIGSFAPGAWVLFMVVMAVLPYWIGFGLKQSQRSVMALGQSSRNISAAFVAFFGITNAPEGMFLMVLLVVPLHVIIGLMAVPPIFAKLADKSAAGAEA